jgi:zinc protease
MEVLDRTKAPDFIRIQNIKLQQPAAHQFSNQSALYSINAGTQDIIRIEFVFNAGSRYQDLPLQAYSTTNLLNEGTKNYNSSRFNEIIDYYGAFLQTDSDKDFSSVSLYTLNKHLQELLPLMKEMLTDAVFPQNELNIFLRNEKQKYLVESQKVNILARRHFLNILFGDDNFYGYFLKIEDYDKLEREHVEGFYKKMYQPGRCIIIASGKVEDKQVDLISDYFGKDWPSGSDGISENLITRSAFEKKHYVFKEDALQSAIRIGRPLFNKTHPDYLGMQVLNTLLGGYFGSRLMANIREDKGYTYGIGSGMISLKKEGYFFISTEVGVDVCRNALNEIYFELKRLREDLVSAEELELVRNYMMGVFLKNVDGPFALADRFKSIECFGLGYEYYDRYFNTINTITPEQIRNLAQKYLNEEDLYELVVGKL